MAKASANVEDAEEESKTTAMDEDTPLGFADKPNNKGAAGSEDEDGDDDDKAEANATDSDEDNEDEFEFVSIP